MTRAKMIFHLPDQINLAYASGSQIRPLAMIKAFENIGYQVDAIIGYGKEREKKIENIRCKIRNGEKYNFFYAENSTTPSLLTEKNHIPSYPFMDFNFFAFCKEQNIPIGLFYRDIYWNFKDFMKELPLWKAWITFAFQKYDLYKYNQLIDILYLPSIKMYRYIPFEFQGKIRELYPACNLFDPIQEERANIGTVLKMLYVGGIGHHYNLKKLVKTVGSINGIDLTICCRKHEWDLVYKDYKTYLADNIKIIHVSGDELNNYYAQTDIACLFFEPIEYRSFAMPVKLFEYLGNGVPIIATRNTEAGDFVEKTNVGWCLEYSENKLYEFLINIINNRQEITVKKKCMKHIAHFHTWEARALQVEKELSI